MAEIIENIKNADYRSKPGISKTDLDHIHISPLHYKIYKESKPEDTPSLLIGKAYHKLIGEPETFSEEFVVAPKIDKRTKAGKAEWAEFLSGCGDKDVITQDDFEKIENMKLAFDDHEIAPALIKNAKFETSIFWDDLDFGVKCKCRPDAIADDGYLIDFKTTASAKPEEFMKSAYKYRYYVQAYWYSKGYEKAYGEKPKGFIFIAQEKTPPYALNVFESDWYFKKLGEYEALEDLRKFSECLKSNEFYGYGYNENTLHYEIQNLTLPPYILKSNFSERMGG